MYANLPTDDIVVISAKGVCITPIFPSPSKLTNIFSLLGPSSGISLTICRRELPVASKLKDELEQYLEHPVENVKNPFAWWSKNRVLYPRLSRMALNYLSIPGMYITTPPTVDLTTPTATSVDVKRVFSKGRLVLSHVRNGLSVQSTRALLCLGAWSKLGLVKDKDLMEAGRLPDIDGDEAELDSDWDNI